MASSQPDQIQQSFENLKSQIRKRIVTDNELEAAKESCANWINSKRKIDKIRTCDDLFECLVYKGVFAPYKINIFRMFQKLLNDDEIYRLLEDHETKVRDQHNSVVLVNEYAIKRQRHEEELQQKISKVKVENMKPLPKPSNFPNTSSSTFLVDKKLEIINILKNGISVTEFDTFARFLSVNSREVEDIQRANKTIGLRTTALMNLFIKRSNNTAKLFLALNQIRRNDLVKAIEELTIK